MFELLVVFCILLAGDAPKIAAQPKVIEVKHLGRNKEGWEVAQTSHFVIFHNQEREFIEKVARIAETTRLKANRKWFGNDGEAWTQKCELILHANVADYTHATGMPMASPGHTVIESDAGNRVVSRRIHLRYDAPGLLDALLPHETTHAVLAGQFGPHQVPRWADEGMALLSESKEKIALHRRALAECAENGELFSLKELIEMKDYPKPARIKAFYAQSVCLTDFLAKERGHVVFTKFVRDGLAKGYEVSLQRHYGCDFAGLEERWQKFLAKEKPADHPPKH